MASDDTRALLGRYISNVLPPQSADRGGAYVPLNDPGTKMPPHQLERALNDPARTFVRPDRTSAYPSETADAARDVGEWMRRLYRFAHRLEALPAGTVPADLASRAARARFLIWSLPFRIGWDDVDLPWSFEPREDVDEPFRFDQDDLRARARQAREEWLGFLGSWEDDPWLAGLHAAGDDVVERDLVWLTRRWPESSGRGIIHPGPLVLEAREDRQRRWWRAARPDHDHVALNAAEQHWLPRGSLVRAAEAVTPARGLQWAALAAVPVTAVAVAAMAVLGAMETARWVAVAVIGVAVLTPSFLPSRYTAVFVLRIPAAAVLGQGLLLSLTAQWWSSPSGWMVGAALIGGALGYTMHEARQHGANRCAAFRRGAWITGVGTAYAFVLSLAVLGFVVPALGDHGSCLEDWWKTPPFSPVPLPTITSFCSGAVNTPPGAVPSAATPIGILVLMTGWSLALGLTAQVIWDDRPVTAPLGRVRRVRGGGA